MKRKMAEHDNLKITIEQTGDKFHIKESSTFRTKEIDFTLGVQFDYTLADGTEVSVSSAPIRPPDDTPVPPPPSPPLIRVCASTSGNLGDGGGDAEGEVHQEGQQQGPDHHQEPGGRGAGAGQ